MCYISRKYLRKSEKRIFKKKGVLFFQKNKLKRKTSLIGSKLSPHKNVTAKKTKYRVVEHSTYKFIYRNSIFISTLQYVYSVWTNTYYRANVTDTGLVFLTPGIFNASVVHLGSFSGFTTLRNITGLPTIMYKVGQIVSNIKSSVNGSLASSAGTYSVVTSVRSGVVSLKLPSSKKVAKKKIKSYLGPNIVIRNLFNYRPKSTLLRVRGIAKNPVDHPNGGRSNTKGSFKTPWGKVAKFSK